VKRPKPPVQRSFELLVSFFEQLAPKRDRPLSAIVLSSAEHRAPRGAADRKRDEQHARARASTTSTSPTGG
jgi:hypothetical protein